VPAELARVLDHYALGELRAAQRTECGFVNDNWIIATDRGRFFLKRRHRDLRRPAVIRAQHALMLRLQRVGFPIPAVVPTTRDETLLISEGQFYEIHEYIEGEPYDHHRSAHLDEAALMLGRFHLSVQGFAPEVLCDLGELYGPLLLKRALTNILDVCLLDRGRDLAPLIRQLDVHIAELSERFDSHGTLPCVVIHGDYYAGNLLFDGDRIIGVVDYDKVRWQPRVVELAEALIYFASHRPGHLKHLVYPGFLDWARFVQFLNSYSRIAVLDETEVCALPDYVRCIWLQISLIRLREKGPCGSEALEALEEVVALGNWAQVNSQRMMQFDRG
jgi:homoserine kinase type II